MNAIRKIPEKTRWRNWADELRQELMTGLTSEVAKSVTDIISETGTTKAESTVRGVRFWTSCRNGTAPNDFLTAAGFEIDFKEDDARHVEEVTFRLNEAWMTILNRVLERKRM